MDYLDKDHLGEGGREEAFYERTEGATYIPPAEVGVCLAGCPAWNSVCGDPECICAPPSHVCANRCDYCDTLTLLGDV